MAQVQLNSATIFVARPCQSGPSQGRPTRPEQAKPSQAKPRQLQGAWSFDFAAKRSCTTKLPSQVAESGGKLPNLGASCRSKLPNSAIQVAEPSGRTKWPNFGPSCRSWHAKWPILASQVAEPSGRSWRASGRSWGQVADPSGRKPLHPPWARLPEPGQCF